MSVNRGRAGKVPFVPKLRGPRNLEVRSARALFEMQNIRCPHTWYQMSVCRLNRKEVLDPDDCEDVFDYLEFLENVRFYQDVREVCMILVNLYPERDDRYYEGPTVQQACYALYYQDYEQFPEIEEHRRWYTFQNHRYEALATAAEEEAAKISKIYAPSQFREMSYESDSDSESVEINRRDRFESSDDESSEEIYVRLV